MLWTQNNLHRRLLSLGSVGQHVYCCIMRDFSAQYYILLLLSIGILSYTE